MGTLISDIELAIDEITALRRDNEILRAKQEMIDLFALVLHTQPANRSRGESLDVVWLLRRQLQQQVELEKQATQKPEG